MKKIKFGLAFAALLSLTACGNQQVFDTTWRFETAICALPGGGAAEYEVVSWKDYEDSDMIQIQTPDFTILTHSSNCYLKTK